MANTNNRGLWLSSFQQGDVADRPTEYPGQGNIAFYFATDEGVLYVAKFVADEGAASWQAVGSVAATTAGTQWAAVWDDSLKTLVLADIPTADPTTEGALWSDSGTVKVSAGA